MNPASLSLDQKFELERLKREAAQSHEGAIAHCLCLFIQMQYMEARYKRAIAERWGLNSSQPGPPSDTPTGNTFSTRDVIDCGDAGHC